MLPEAYKGLIFGADMWIDGDRVDCFKEIIIDEVKLWRHHCYMEVKY